MTRNGRPASMADVAKLVGVSHQTVSRVVNGKGRVSPRTRERVQAAIDQDVTLTATQKAAQKQAITAEVTKANQAIDAADNADAVDQAKNAGVKAIYDQH